MDNYLIDRGTLGQFVDELIKKKAPNTPNTEELTRLREESIKTLDDKIGMAIFGKFTKEQNAEFNQLLDKGDASTEEYDDFFQKHGINEEQIIVDAMKSFAEDFLGGQDE